MQNCLLLHIWGNKSQITGGVPEEGMIYGPNHTRILEAWHTDDVIGKC